jgi:hypothetical protein
VQAAILVLAEEMAHDATRLPAIIERGPWKGKAGPERARELVDGFFTFWEDHRGVLRVVDLATAEGDQRFRQIRTRLLTGVTDALASVMAGFQREGKVPSDLDPRAEAGVLVTMLAHVAQHRWGFEFWGIRSGDARTAMARHVAWGITGQKPPDPANRR